MLVLGPIGFAAPWLLAGLLALPVLWWVLRAVPPAPIRRRFPGVALLLGLADEEAQAATTPWWLLALRIAAAALLIIGFAGPVLGPRPAAEPGQGPLLLFVDAGWADARDWPERMAALAERLEQAGRAGRPVAVVAATDLPAGDLPLRPAADWAARLGGLAPAPYLPDGAAVSGWAAGLEGAAFETVWLSGGLAYAGQADLLAAFEQAGPVEVVSGAGPVLGLVQPRLEDGVIRLSALRAPAGPAQEVALRAHGRDPAGAEAVLAGAMLAFGPGAAVAEAELVLPAELRNRITRFALEGVQGAGAVSLVADALRRREVALIAPTGGQEALDLLAPLHYLRTALAPVTDLLEGDSLADLLEAAPDVIILADVATLAPAEATALAAWVEGGGLLIRFAGPRLAAAQAGREGGTPAAGDPEDPLLPVRLRAGGRAVGGAMSWGAPRALAPFPEGSPFAGLAVPGEVRVSAQVLAQPGPDLAARTIAALEDGTPLVTAAPRGQGRVVLFHVTANADWSSLPLSGLFLEMLERLVAGAGGVAAPVQADAGAEAGAEAGAGAGGEAGAVSAEGVLWVAETVLDGFGVAGPAGARAGVPGAALAGGTPGPDMPPGIYAAGPRRVALNAVPDAGLPPAPAWPASVAQSRLAGGPAEAARALGPWALTLALGLLCVDTVAALWLSGRLSGRRSGLRSGQQGGPARNAALGLAVALALALGPLTPARAQVPQMPEVPPRAADEAQLVAATSEVVLAHVITGDRALDDLAQAGLAGLSQVLRARSSIEPAAPMAVDLERDALSVFPFLYWPVSPDAALPSAQAYARLNRYLRSGGMILFDTRDGDVAGFGSATPEGRRLQALAAPLDIPRLEPIPPDHVLTRTFYLIQDFPGRHASPSVWVEAAPSEAAQAEGVPFRTLNDGVSPVVIGGNDWAAAWARNEAGEPLYPVGRGMAGERQREMADRFGVNLIMHVLTGNYKSDQVHVPALLERLGQ